MILSGLSDTAEVAEFFPCSLVIGLHYQVEFFHYLTEKVHNYSRPVHDEFSKRSKYDTVRFYLTTKKQSHRLMLSIVLDTISSGHLTTVLLEKGALVEHIFLVITQNQNSILWTCLTTFVLTSCCCFKVTIGFFMMVI